MHGVDSGGCNSERVFSVCSRPLGNYDQFCDLAGNVSEWVLDDWHNNYNGAPSTSVGWCDGVDCDTVSNSSTSVVRGGNWYSDPYVLRTTGRTPHPRDTKGNGIGFRLARDFVSE